MVDAGGGPSLTPGTDRAEHGGLEEDRMDPVTLLTLVVAVIIVLSAYFLFNGVPSLGKDRNKRPPHR